MDLTTEDKSLFVKQVSDIMDKTNPGQNTIMRKFLAAIHRKENYIVKEFNEEDNYYYQMLIDAAVGGKKGEIELAITSVKSLYSDEANNNTSNIGTTKQEAPSPKKQKTEKEKNDEEKACYIAAIKAIQSDSGTDFETRMCSLKQHIDDNESKVLDMLSAKEIKEMIETSQRSMLDGGLESWEIKPIMNRVEELKVRLETVSKLESYEAQSPALHIKDKLTARIATIKPEIMTQIMEFSYNFVKGATYTCKKCTKQFKNIKEAHKHIATAEMNYYNSLL